ncbi:MAG TPA: M56 family metallopeptidase [Rhizomicrobium sp.]|jgi:beta-lactamase regulating signal transducer with metallopeptidase domain|nr:M56 family metallopeptidase [Rhizomicrobium sp.]
MSALFDHLWQSTLFAAALGLLTLAFRHERAGVRYALWFAASAKFLVPFAALTALGGLLLAPVYVAPPVFHRIGAMTQPFAAVTSAAPVPSTLDLHIGTILLALWIFGICAVGGVWLVRWAKLRAVVRAARTLRVTPQFAVKVSATLLEPGLVGIWRPVLLLPEGLLAHLSPRERAAIEAHERCHARRLDNLTAAIHMLVTSLFWFHPLLWWLGARLIDERERACDEAVLAEGSDPSVYARSILAVCRHTMPSPLACAAGISGSTLSKRMETIMENKPALRLSRSKKTLLAALAAAALAAPLAIGLASAAGAGDPALMRERLAEQRKPRAEIAIDPARFDKFAGYYRLTASDVFVIRRTGNHYFEGTIGQAPEEMYPESDSKFFLKGTNPPAQFSFTSDASGRVTELVLHQSGEEQHAPRIADDEGRRAEAFLAKRIAENTASPGTGNAVRRQLDGLISGRPDYDLMAPTLAAGTRQMLPQLHAMAAKWGSVKSVTFAGVAKDGTDVYDVVCANGRSKWQIGPLTPEGKISTIFFGPAS